MKTIVQIAIEIACKAHDGQYRRDGVTPYITHPASVAESVKSDTHKAIAWLHDVLEDTNLTHHDLIAAGIPPYVVDSVYAITRKPDEDYDAYLRRVRWDIPALAVKIADIEHNLIDNPTPKQRAKYEKALQFLSE